MTCYINKIIIRGNADELEKIADAIGTETDMLKIAEAFGIDEAINPNDVIESIENDHVLIITTSTKGGNNIALWSEIAEKHNCKACYYSWDTENDICYSDDSEELFGSRILTKCDDGTDYAVPIYYNYTTA